MVSSIGGSNLGLLNSYLTASIKNTAQAIAYAPKSATGSEGQEYKSQYGLPVYDYIDHNQTVQIWSDEQFRSETAQNLLTLQAALKGYKLPCTISSYSFSLSKDGTIQDWQGNVGKFTDAKGVQASSNQIIQILQNADTDHDGLISTQELQDRFQVVCPSINLSDEEAILSQIGQLGVCTPDRFIQVNNCDDGTTELTVYKTPSPHSLLAETQQIVGHKTYTPTELKGLLPMLQKADTDHDGVVTKEELQNYKKALEAQRDKLHDLATSKMISDALSTDQLTVGKNGQGLYKINTQLKQIDTLLQQDTSGTSNFDYLSGSLGGGEGLSIGNIMAVISG